MKYKNLLVYSVVVGILYLLTATALEQTWVVTFGIVFFLLFLLHFLKTLVALRLEQFNSAKFHILFSVSYLVLYLKIFYSYYNVLFSLVLLAVYASFFFKKKRPKSPLKNFIFHMLLFLNILLLMIPAKYLLVGHSQEHILWKPNITWEEFSSKNIDTSTIGAEIYTYFGGYPNRVYNYPQAVVFATMSTTKSWKNENRKSRGNRFLLTHEQKHFDITQVFTEKAQDSIHKVFGKNSKEIQQLVNYFIEKEDSFQNEYDSLTAHGTNVEVQKIYNKKIANLLKK